MNQFAYIYMIYLYDKINYYNYYFYYKQPTFLEFEKDEFNFMKRRYA